MDSSDRERPAPLQGAPALLHQQSRGMLHSEGSLPRQSDIQATQRRGMLDPAVHVLDAGCREHPLHKAVLLDN